MLAGVIVAAVVSFLIASLLLKTGKQKEEDLEAASSRMKDMKSQGNTANAAITADNREADRAADIATSAASGQNRREQNCFPV